MGGRQYKSEHTEYDLVTVSIVISVTDVNEAPTDLSVSFSKIQERRATLWNRIRWALSFFLVTTLDYGVTRRLNFGLEGE